MAGATAVIVVTGSILLVVYCLLLVARWTLPFPVVMVGAFVACILFASVPPQESMDVYAYGYFGHLVTAYKQNPYTVAHDACSQDPYLRLARTPQPIQSPYGPGWTGLSAAIVAATGTRTGLTLLIFRVIAIGAFFGVILLLRTLLVHHPNANNALALFAWNPLVLFEVANNGHNDIVLVFLLLLALFALRRKKYIWVAPALALAFLVKFVAMLIVPLVLIALLRNTTLRRRDWFLLTASAIVSLAAALFAFLPFWRGIGTFNYLIYLSQYIGLPYLHPLALGVGVLRLAGVSESNIPPLVMIVGRTIFGCIALWAAFRLWKKGNEWLPESVGILFAGFLAFGLTYFEPWYLLWLLPFIFFWPKRAWRPAALIITIVGLAGTSLV